MAARQTTAGPLEARAEAATRAAAALPARVMLNTAWCETALSATAGSAVLGAAAAALLHAAPPLQDFPEWMYQGWLLKGLLLGDPQVQAVARVADFPVPNAFLQALLAVLNLAFAPLLAGKLAVLLYLGIGTAVLLRVARRAPPALRGSLRALLVLSILLSQRFWNGYLAYQLGLWMLAELLLWADRPQRGEASSSPGRGALLAIAGVAMFFTHAVIYGGYLLVLAFLARARRSASALVAALPSALLALWYAAGRMRAGGARDPLFAQWLGSVQEALQYRVYTAGKWGPFVNFYLAPKQSALQELPLAYWAGVGLDLGFGAAILLLAGWSLLRLRGELGRAAPISARVSLACLAGFALLPFTHLLGVVNFGERLLGVGLVAGLAALAALRDPRVVGPLRALAVLAALGLPYLVVPCFVVQPVRSGAAASEFDDWLEQYYTDQRYFNSRSNQFIDRVDFMSHPERPGALPSPFFETSVVVPRGAPR